MTTNKKLIKKAVFSILIAAILFTSPQHIYGFSDKVLQRGATGDDVIELQARLQYISYYTGKINGVFDWGTYWAVRNFQHDFGIDIDGLVGDQMKQKLEEVTEFDRDYVYGKLAKGEEPQHYGKTGKGPDPEWPPPGQRDPGNRHQTRYVPPDTPDAEARRAPEEPEAPAPEAPAPEAPAPEAPAPEAPAPEAPAPEAPAPEAPAPEAPAPEAPAPEAPAPEAPAPEAPAPEEPAPEAPAPEEAAPEEPAAEEEPEVGQLEEAVNIPEGFSENDLQLMARAVYGEARGEPYEGQVAVAAVILNRVAHSDFPNTVAGVIFEPRAFTVVADGQINLDPNETARRAVMDAINGIDPTGGLVYYFNPQTATSPWMFQRQRVKQIGKHVFVR